MSGTFEDSVKHHVEALTQCSLRELERNVAEKRMRWLHDGHHMVDVDKPTPRFVYELLFREYMGLNLEELPILEERTDKIRWRSYNPCPTLEACGRLGLDTRRICRSVYEKSTQAFISTLDPALRFHRSYIDIRPHAPYCEEWIVRLDFEALMRIAIQEARLSLDEGNKGYGAVVVFDGEVITRAHDTAATEGDPSLHAEVNAIRAACATLGDANLTGAVLFSSCEPCPMCSSLAVWANVTSIVFGASIQETKALGKSRITIPAREVVQRSPALVEVIGGILREECLALYTE